MVLSSRSLICSSTSIILLLITSTIFLISVIVLFIFLCLFFSSSSSAAAAKSLQSCPTQCDPIDGSPPGSSVHGIFQARVLEWGAIAFSVSSSSSLLNICCIFSMWNFIIFLRFWAINGNPLQCSCLENAMVRGACRATVHGIARVRHDLVLSFFLSYYHYSVLF